MREDGIKIRPFEIVSILDYKGIQQMNEHGQVRLSARIRSDKRDEYIQEAVKETWVEILGYDENGNEKNIFCGICILRAGWVCHGSAYLYREQVNGL